MILAAAVRTLGESRKAGARGTRLGSLPKRPPKKRCIRGHSLAKVGWIMNPCRYKRLDGTVSLRFTRRCKACLREDEAKCHGVKRKRRA